MYLTTTHSLAPPLILSFSNRTVIKLDTLTERGLGVFEGTSFLDAKKLLDWDSLPEPRHLHAWDKVSFSLYLIHYDIHNKVSFYLVGGG